MPEIYTVTLNPVIDIHFTLDALRLGTENVPAEHGRLAAGKGVNVSRVLRRHGYTAPAYMLLGEENRTDFLRLLTREQIPGRYISIPGRIRENISLNCPAAKQETRICMKNFTARDEDVTELGNLLLQEYLKDAYIALSGSLPGGVSHKAFITLCHRLKEAGARIVVDCPSLSLVDLTAIRPWLIKPNRQEAIRMLQDAGESEAALVSGEELALKLSESFEQVLVSLGKDGIVYAGTGLKGEAAALSKPAHPTQVYTTVGAGDSLVAGFLYGAIQVPGDVQKALDFGLQFAAETCAAHPA